jgi:AcrR family transcriptional regulator
MGARTVATPRENLTKERVLRAAVDVADRGGIDALSMREVAHELGVVPMALYRHVANKDEMQGGMLDLVLGEIDAPPDGAHWKPAVRERILSARRVLLRHPWAARVIESRTNPSPAMLDYMDSMLGLFLAGGFSMDLTHHVMHAMGSRLLGFTRELYDDTTPPDPKEMEALVAMAGRYPHIAELAGMVLHDDATVVGGRGCDDQFEFEFALDLLLDGIERIKDRS